MLENLPGLFVVADFFNALSVQVPWLKENSKQTQEEYIFIRKSSTFLKMLLLVNRRVTKVSVSFTFTMDQSGFFSSVKVSWSQFEASHWSPSHWLIHHWSFSRWIHTNSDSDSSQEDALPGFNSSNNWLARRFLTNTCEASWLWRKTADGH